jgi:hypothetical protein
MSNYLAIATVTAVLRDILQEAAIAADLGAEVTTRRPEQVGDGDQDKPLVNLFLYRVTPNAVWGNADLPTRSADGRLVRRPQAALDLHYLLSFYGPEKELVPQQMLGRVISALHAQPLLSPDKIRRTIKPPLDGSDLAEQVERIRFSPLSLSLEELSKLWSVFFQIPYTLSVAYQASIVLIEAQEEAPQPALPVLKRGEKDRGWDSFPGGIPQIEQILPQVVGPGAEITLKGGNLVADRFTVKLKDREVTFDRNNPATVTPTGDLQVQIPSDLPAGIIPVSVRVGSGITSNTVALVLRPQISNLEQKSIMGKNGIKVKVVTFDIKPEVQLGQRGLLLLNERKDNIDDPQPRRAYSIAFSCQDQVADKITVPLPQDPKEAGKCQVQPGRYLVRVQIDGAESQLEPPTSDGEPYAGPLVTIDE